MDTTVSTEEWKKILEKLYGRVDIRGGNWYAFGSHKVDWRSNQIYKVGNDLIDRRSNQV